MGIEDLGAFVGRWELRVDLPGADDAHGHVTFERMETSSNGRPCPLPTLPTVAASLFA